MLTSRRSFIKSSVLFSLLAPMSAVAIGSTSRNSDALLDLEPQSESAKVFQLSLRTDLIDSPNTLNLVSGELSSPVTLRDGTEIRVVCVPTGEEAAFGPTYLLTIVDSQGEQLAEMTIGSNTTATFAGLGLQVYLLVLGHTARS